MDEHNEQRTRLRAVGMELFRRNGLRFTMQQAAAMMHISKKTIYAVYPSRRYVPAKLRLFLDWVSGLM